MAIYTVHEPAGQKAAEQAVFVRDKFSWPGFFFGPFWLLAKGMWLVLIGYLVLAAMFVSALVYLLPASLVILPLVIFLTHLLFGFEAPNLCAWTIARRGYSLKTVISGHDLDDCERRYFANRINRDAIPEPIAPLPPGPEIFHPGSNVPGSNVIGIFPRPGGDG